MKPEHAPEELVANLNPAEHSTQGTYYHHDGLADHDHVGYLKPDSYSEPACVRKISDTKLKTIGHVTHPGRLYGCELSFA